LHHFAQLRQFGGNGIRVNGQAGESISARQGEGRGGVMQFFDLSLGDADCFGKLGAGLRGVRIQRNRASNYLKYCN
jgi:hypothetical protein